MRLVQRAGCETLTVGAQRGQQRVRAEVIGEGETQTELSGKACAVIRRAQQINRRQRHVGRYGPDSPERMTCGKVATAESEQFA